jgi:murein L,D-transpeptidase YafK
MSFHHNFGRLTNFGRLARWAAPVLAAAALAGCQDTGSLSQRSLRPIPPETLALMEQAGVSKDAPTLIRAYKKEAELEVWKMRPDGKYVHLKTYPMCRWSGQLGPKVREGDRQVPEGFYAIGPAQMNPNSAYYLSFNVGYPNAYDRAWGRGGGSIMVHGACSSAGCFSMTDKQIAEIYAIARTSLNAGQRAIQMQSYPFKMTAENLAKHRLDPHIDFWKQLKEGSDHFEVTQQEPTVGVCGKRYVFNATPANGHPMDASAPCPALKRNEHIQALVAQKAAKDDMKVAELVASGVKPVRIVYQDGGQHPEFSARVAEVSRPEALTAPMEIVLEEKATKGAGKPAAKSPVVTLAAAKAATQAKAQAEAAVTQQVAVKPAESAPEPSRLSAFAADATGSISGLLGLQKSASPSERSQETAQPLPVAAKAAPSAPPRRAIDSGKKPQASLSQEPKAKVVLARSAEPTQPNR